LKGISAMTHHKKNSGFFLRGSIFAIAAISSLAATQASATAVSDSGTRRNTAKAAAAAESSAAQETRQTKLEEDQLSAIGEPGAGASILNLPGFASMGSSSEFYENMEKFGFDMCAINLCEVGNNPTDTTDIEEARDWANETFFSSVALNAEQTRDLQEVRRRAIAYTASNAFAISTTVHNDLAAGSGSAQALEDMVDSATSLRSDIQASSAIALANYKIAVQQLAVLTSILDVHASAAIQQSSLYHEDGGSSFPDAFKDGDYRDDFVTRNKVTTPSKGSPD